MKGIYLTQEGKQEIEAKIAELEKRCSLIFRAANSDKEVEMMLSVAYANNKARIDSLSEILSSAIILPVEESFYTVENKLKYHCGRTGCSKDGATLREYPNGVIIQPK